MSEHEHHQREMIATLPFDAAPCRCVKDHRPKPLIVERHHLFPQGLQRRMFGGQVRDRETVPLCSNAHDNVHEVLDALLRGERPPPVNVYLRGLAAEGARRIRAAERGAYGYADERLAP